MKRYKPLFESTFSAVTEINTDKPSDQEILRLAISAELSAINMYRQLADKTNNTKLKNILLDVAVEEKVHVGEFEAVLRELDEEEVQAQKQGAKEVKKL